MAQTQNGTSVKPGVGFLIGFVGALVVAGLGWLVLSALDVPSGVVWAVIPIFIFICAIGFLFSSASRKQRS